MSVGEMDSSVLRLGNDNKNNDKNGNNKYDGSNKNTGNGNKDNNKKQ